MVNERRREEGSAFSNGREQEKKNKRKKKEKREGGIEEGYKAKIRRIRMDHRESRDNKNSVALKLAKHLFSKEANHKNLVFSPVSLHVVLSIVAAGSKGPTRDQLLSFLRSKSTDNLNSFASQLVAVVLSDGSPAGGPRLCFANDEVMNEVNSWAEKKTNGLIKEVLPPRSDNLTKLIFANALYFKGAWNQKFDASITKDYDFHLLNGSSVKVPFMISKEKQFISSFDGFKVLGLPYKQGEDKRQFSMYLLLPDIKDGLSALVEKVGSKSGFLDHKLPHEKVKVGDFRIPRFKISFGFETSNVLKELELVLPFSEGGLTEMVDSPLGQLLYVSKIFHKSFIEVNEEGTEAAATSAFKVLSRSMRIPTKIDFVADHPFLFLIREDMTGTVLFIGQVLNPLAG